MIVGTRGSNLAIVQTERVCKKLSELGVECEIKTVQSLGDVITDRGLYEMPTIGVFVKKLDMMLLDGKIDIAVHSMKDMPSEREEELETSAVLPRDSPFDALVSRYRLADMPEGAVIGTSSVRRRYQFLNYVGERGVKVTIKDIRGNVGTRIAKFRRGEYDSLILAEAGFERLKLDIEYERLDRDPFVPSPRQGIIAVVARRGSKESELLKQIDDPETRIEAEVEEEVLKVIGGGCSLPVGVHATAKGRAVELAVYVGASDLRYKLERVVLGKEYMEETRELAQKFKSYL